jgi:KDO2-lipid IV(A) lauroyltransferase
MALAFPEWTPSKRKKTLRGVYRHYAWILVEYLATLNDPPSVRDWFVKAEGKQFLDEALTKKRGAVLLFGHFGNWELLGGWLAFSGYPIDAMVREPDDPDLQGFLESYRNTMGMGTIGKDSLREPIKRLKQGRFVGIAGDQHWGNMGIDVPFFGRSCSTAPGPAAYALLSGAPLIPIAAYRLGPFRYFFEAQKPIEVPKTGSRDEKIREMTFESNRALEKMIRRAPEQWLWMHRRWRE